MGFLTLVTPVANYTPTSANTAAEKSSERLQCVSGMEVQYGLLRMSGCVGDEE